MPKTGVCSLSTVPPHCSLQCWVWGFPFYGSLSLLLFSLPFSPLLLCRSCSVGLQFFLKKTCSVNRYNFVCSVEVSSGCSNVTILDPTPNSLDRTKEQTVGKSKDRKCRCHRHTFWGKKKHKKLCSNHSELRNINTLPRSNLGKLCLINILEKNYFVHWSQSFIIISK